MVSKRKCGLAQKSYWAFYALDVPVCPLLNRLWVLLLQEPGVTCHQGFPKTCVSQTCSVSPLYQTVGRDEIWKFRPHILLDEALFIHCWSCYVNTWAPAGYFKSDTMDSTSASLYPRLGLFSTEFWAATSDVQATSGGFLQTYFKVARQYGSLTTVGASTKLNVRLSLRVISIQTPTIVF